MSASQNQQGQLTPASTIVKDHWQRLSVRMIWVDLVQIVLSLLPVALAVWVVGLEAGDGLFWPVLWIAAVGIFGVIGDVRRLIFTRYRVTSTHVELKTGALFRVHRSIQRDRIRSVDIEAKLRHRIGGLRIVKIGAGQQAAAGESALALDAVSTVDALALQDRLVGTVDAHLDSESADSGDGETVSFDRTRPLAVFARFEPSWVIYNMFSVWAYVLALGVGWGGYWLITSFGVDIAGFVEGLLDWESIGTFGTVAIAFLVVSVLGALGLGVAYFTEYWNFELARTRGPEGTMLRTRQGLFTTREVNRDENRIRGVEIAEPLLWRWMGVSDTTVITTGLSIWSMQQPTAILPRGPVSVARRVSAEVLGSTDDPVNAPLTKHPQMALQLRIWLACACTAGIGLILGWLAVTDVLPYEVLWTIPVILLCSLGAAFIAYRALGHAIVGRYLVTRSGLGSRSTIILERSAVSTIVIRESLLQRFLGLRTVATMTAAGYGGYDTPDLEKDASLRFATEAAPGLLDPFLTDTDGVKPA